MSGSQKNTWSSYLNGKTSHFNFSYKDETAHSIPMQNPISMPNMPPQPSTPALTNRKKQSGGKKKSRRHTKKSYYK